MKAKHLPMLCRIGMVACTIATLSIVAILVWPETTPLHQKPVLREFQEVSVDRPEPAKCGKCGFSGMSCLCKKQPIATTIRATGFVIEDWNQIRTED